MMPSVISFLVFLFTFSSLVFNVPTHALPVLAASKIVPVAATKKVAAAAPAKVVVPDVTAAIPVPPFFSQFADISAPSWRKVGCGVTSLAMVIDYYKPDAVSVDTLLTRGIAGGAYLQDAGWTYNGLIALSTKYGLTGSSHDLGKLSMDSAYTQLSASLEGGPVIASIHYKFDPKSTIPHLVVINGIKGDTVYYNDPAAKTGSKQISSADFKKGWKKRFIVVRPA